MVLPQLQQQLQLLGSLSLLPLLALMAAMAGFELGLAVDACCLRSAVLLPAVLVA